MKAVSLEKQSVAWFKLAECIGRGEKERALSLLRLLTYSLDSNKPFIKQLEADILAFFEDSQAVTHYIQAAHMYYQEGNAMEASVVYEKLIALEQKIEFLEKIISLYTEIKDQRKAIYYKHKLYFKLLDRGLVTKAIELLGSFDKELTMSDKIDSYKKLIFASITHKYGQQEIVTEYLRKVLDDLLRFGSDAELKIFLSDLKALNAMWHKDAADYLKK